MLEIVAQLYILYIYNTRENIEYITVTEGVVWVKYKLRELLLSLEEDKARQILLRGAAALFIGNEVSTCKKKGRRATEWDRKGKEILSTIFRDGKIPRLRDGGPTITGRLAFR